MMSLGDGGDRRGRDRGRFDGHDAADVDQEGAALLDRHAVELTQVVAQRIGQTPRQRRDADAVRDDQHVAVQLAPGHVDLVLDAAEDAVRVRVEGVRAAGFVVGTERAVAELREGRVDLGRTLALIAVGVRRVDREGRRHVERLAHQAFGGLAAPARVAVEHGRDLGPVEQALAGLVRDGAAFGGQGPGRVDLLHRHAVLSFGLVGLAVAHEVHDVTLADQIEEEVHCRLQKQGPVRLNEPAGLPRSDATSRRFVGF